MEQRDDLRRLLEETRQREEASSREREALQKRVAELMEENSRRMEGLMDQVRELTMLLKEKEKENSRLQSRLDVANRVKYGRTSQKGNRSGKDKNEGGKPVAHTDAEDGFDGSPASLPQDMDVDSPAETATDGMTLAREKEAKILQEKMRRKLDEMLSDCAPRHGDLMRSAVRYFDHFWVQVFRYQDDGEYTIDNNLAERFIRPLANERKNSLFFGSHKMARVSAAYHSVISTCKFHGIFILEYLKRFFQEIAAGNRDYHKLMPATIGITANNY